MRTRMILGTSLAVTVAALFMVRTHSTGQSPLSTPGSGERPAADNKTKAVESTTTLDEQKSRAALAAGEKRIRAALDKEISIQFHETPLDDIVNSISKKLEIPIHFEHKALEANNIDVRQHCTVDLQHISASSFEHVLRTLNLVWIVEPDRLLITTQQFADSLFLSKTYPVRDLVTIHGQAGELAEYQPLIDAIFNQVKPMTWEPAGGQGDVRAFPKAGCLVVGNAPDIHETIDCFFSALQQLRQRQRLFAPPGKNGVTAEAKQPPRPDDAYYDAIPVEPAAMTAARRKLEKQLQQPVRLKLDDMRLIDNLDYISEKLELPLMRNDKALTANSIDVSQRLNTNIGPLPGYAALERLLAPHQLGTVFAHGVLIVTTEQDADTCLHSRVYPVADLVVAGEGEKAQFELDELQELIQTSVKPMSWEPAGGPGGMSFFGPSGALVISQTDNIHAEIATLLHNVREARAAQKIPTPALADYEQAYYREAVQRQKIEAEQRKKAAAERGGNGMPSHSPLGTAPPRSLFGGQF